MKDPDNLKDDCAKLLPYITTIMGGIDIYDFWVNSADKSPWYFKDYLNQPNV